VDSLDRVLLLASPVLPLVIEFIQEFTRSQVLFVQLSHVSASILRFVLLDGVPFPLELGDFIVSEEVLVIIRAARGPVTANDPHSSHGML